MTQRAPFAAITLLLAWLGFAGCAIWAGYTAMQAMRYLVHPDAAITEKLKFGLLAATPGLLGMAAAAASGVLAEMSRNQCRYQNAVLDE